MTFSFITFTRFFFRGESPEIVVNMWHQIFNDFSWNLIFSIITTYKMVFILWTAGMVIHWLPVRTKEKYKEWFIFLPNYLKVMIAVVVVFVIYQSITSDLQPFIYFQF
jgi:hypothetical protein